MNEPSPPRTRADHARPIFARVYRVIGGLVTRGRVGECRRELLERVSGRLLMVGVGPGFDLDHVPPSVSTVVAVEPSAPMLAAADARVGALRRRGVGVLPVAAVGEALPLPDASVDAVLCAFVLCSVADPLAVLAEVRRVLRPGGHLLLLEHVRAPSGSVLARVQVLLDPAWRRLAGGCSCARDTRASVAAAGFDDAQVRSQWMPNFPLCAYHVAGPARVAPAVREAR